MFRLKFGNGAQIRLKGVEVLFCVEEVRIYEATEKHPVTPGAILPAREQLGELLLELKQPAAALQEFETSLLSAPNRFNGLYGAARAAELAGKSKEASTYYAQLVKVCDGAKSDRPELGRAKALLAKN